MIRESVGDAIVETIDVTSGQVTVAGAQVTIDPAADLGSLTGYYVTIAATAFTDTAGNAFAGIANSSTWNFTTADTVAPTVSTFAPANGDIDVAPDSNLVVTFDEDVAVGTGDIVIRESVGDAIVETIDVTSGQVTVAGAQVTIDPAADLGSLTGYYVTIAATAFTDTAGNAFAGIANSSTWNFTTADTVAPTVSTFAPANGDIDVAPDSNLVVTFDEDVAVGTGDIVIRESVGDAIVETIDVTSGQVTVAGAQVTIDPAADLGSLTGYYVTIAATAFTDTAGNAFAGIANSSTWNFTTIT